MRKNISFDVLDYKEYVLNGDENNVLRIATSDYGIIERLYKAQEDITAMYDKISKLKNPDVHILAEMDSEARRIVNAVFDDDVCTKAFGGKNCLSEASNGKAMLLNFLEAVVPEIMEDFKGGMKSLQKNTAKYTAAVEAPPVKVPYNVIQPVPAVPDLSGLTQEQKLAVLAQLMK